MGQGNKGELHIRVVWSSAAWHRVVQGRAGWDRVTKANCTLEWCRVVQHGIE